MKNPHWASEGTGKNSGTAAEQILPNQARSNTCLCQRWSATDGGVYCRLCWHNFTHPKLLQIAEGSA